MGGTIQYKISASIITCLCLAFALTSVLFVFFGGGLVDRLGIDRYFAISPRMDVKVVKDGLATAEFGCDRVVYARVDGDCSISFFKRGKNRGVIGVNGGFAGFVDIDGDGRFEILHAVACRDGMTTPAERFWKDCHFDIQFPFGVHMFARVARIGDDGLATVCVPRTPWHVYWAYALHHSVDILVVNAVMLWILFIWRRRMRTSNSAED